MWWPFKKADPKKAKLAEIDKKIASHKQCFLGLCRDGRASSKKARLHRRLYYLWEERRLEFIDGLEPPCK